LRASALTNANYVCCLASLCRLAVDRVQPMYFEFDLGNLNERFSYILILIVTLGMGVA